MKRIARPNRSQNGQIVPIVALVGVLLIGMTALAVDLSVNTQSERNLQNVTDTSALSGVRNLPGNPRQALKDALDVLERNSPWVGNVAWLTSAQAAISGSCTTATTCTVTVSGPAGFTNYTVSASSPPATPRNSAYNSTSYLEVDLSQNSTNGFGGVIGSGSSTEKGHSIAYYQAPPGPFQYAFFAKLETQSGNSNEKIVGDAFVGSGYAGQSSGHATLCVLELTGNEAAALDTDGDAGAAPDNDVDDQGHVVFSVVPPTVGKDPNYLNGASSSNCPTGPPAKDLVTAQANTPTTSANCPANSTATSYLSGGSTIWACQEAVPPVPNIPFPINPSPLPNPLPLACVAGSGTVNAATIPAVYTVPSGCTANLDFSLGDIKCVSLKLSSGSSVAVIDKKSNDYISAYGSDPSDSLSTAALTALGISVPGSACPGSSINQDRSVIWAPDTTVSPMPTALSNSSTGCCSTTLFIGTIFAPDQQVTFNSNQALEDVGSIYCGQWNVQSGAHPNPVVTYDSGGATSIGAIMRLTE